MDQVKYSAYGQVCPKGSQVVRQVTDFERASKKVAKFGLVRFH